MNCERNEAQFNSNMINSNPSVPSNELWPLQTTYKSLRELFQKTIGAENIGIIPLMLES